MDKGSNATSCVQAALQERQSQRREQALWAAPNTLLLSPLRAATGANSGLGERALGVLALLPVVGWAGRGLGLAADVARGLSAARDVAATAADVTQAAEAGGEGPIAYLRGTSLGYPGSPALQRLAITPATTDPVVATIFGTESENYGLGVVHIATPEDLAGVEIGPGSVRAQLEAEVAVGVAPTEFAERASITLSASRARSILAGLGIYIPEQISGYAVADELLRSTPRLLPEQIQAFVQAASGE